MLEHIIPEKSCYPVNITDLFKSGILPNSDIPQPYSLTIKGIKTGEFRIVKPNEWYLSGSMPECYYAPKGVNYNMYIIRLYIVKQITSFEIIREIK